MIASLAVNVSAEVISPDNVLVYSSFSLGFPNTTSSIPLGSSMLYEPNLGEESIFTFSGEKSMASGSRRLLHQIQILPTDLSTSIAQRGDAFSFSFGDFSYVVHYDANRLSFGEVKESFRFEDFTKFGFSVLLVGESGSLYNICNFHEFSVSDDSFSHTFDSGNIVITKDSYYSELNGDLSTLNFKLDYLDSLPEDISSIVLDFAFYLPAVQVDTSVTVDFWVGALPFQVSSVDLDPKDFKLDSIRNGVSDVVQGIKDLPQNVGKELERVFVPDKEQLNIQVDRIKDVFKEENFGAVFEAGSIIQNFFSTLPATVADADTSITFPGVSVDLAGVTFEVEEQEVLVVPRGFEALQIASKLITSIVCSLAAINALENIGRKILRY